MSTSAVSSLSIFQELQTFRQDRRADLQQLGSALQSGDLNAAQQAYSTLVALGQNGPYGNSEPFSRPDRAQAFDDLGKALQAGDLAGAQAAFAKLQPTGGHHHGHGSDNGSPAVVVTLDGGPQTAGTDTESIYQQMHDFRQARKSDINQLGQALQSGDLNAAQQEYNALVQLGQSGPFKSQNPFQRADREKDFEAIGKALQSGDLAGAKQAFAALEATFGDQHPEGTTGVIPPIIINILPDTPPGPGPTGPPTPAPVGTTAPPAPTPGPTGPPTPAPVGTTAPPAPTPGPTGPPTPAPVGTTAPPAPTPGPTGPPTPGPGPTTLPPSEIVINLGGSQGGSNQGVVINIGGGSGSSSSEEVQINFGDSSGSGGHLTIDVNPGQNGSGEQISINATQGSSSYQLVLNLTEASQASQTGSQLSLQA